MGCCDFMQNTRLDCHRVSSELFPQTYSSLRSELTRLWQWGGWHTFFSISKTASFYWFLNYSYQDNFLEDFFWVMPSHSIWRKWGSRRWVRYLQLAANDWCLVLKCKQCLCLPLQRLALWDQVMRSQSVLCGLQRPCWMSYTEERWPDDKCLTRHAIWRIQETCAT